MYWMQDQNRIKHLGVIRKAISKKRKSKKGMPPLPKVYEKKRLFKEDRMKDQAIWVLGWIFLGTISIVLLFSI